MSFNKPTYEDLKQRFKEFQSAPSDQIQMAIDDANNELYEVLKNEDNSGLAINCILYFAAHKLAASLRGSGNIEQLAPLSSKSGGGISLSFQVGNSANDYDLQFDSTQYGQEFLRLRKMFASYVLVV